MKTNIPTLAHIKLLITYWYKKSSVLVTAMLLMVSFIISYSGINSVNAKPFDLPIKIVTEDEAPLQYMMNNEVMGMTTNIVKQAFEHANIASNIHIYPWARALQIVKSNPNTFIYSLVRSPERESEFHWIGEILTLKLAFLAIDDNKKTLITSLEDVKKIKLGVLRNDYTHSLLTSNGLRDNIK